MKIVWRSTCGDSRIYCGDGIALMAEMAADSVDCVWTDPPYLLSNDGLSCRNGRAVCVNKGEWDRSAGIENDYTFHFQWLAACYRVLKPGGTIWVSGTMHSYPIVGFAMLRLGYRILNDIVWEKPSPPPNLGCRCFTHSTEILLWATKRKTGSRHTFNYVDMCAEAGGKQMRNVWREFSPPSKFEKRFGRHPTQKPVRLIERCLRASTVSQDLVFDPFAGTASTACAAIPLGRRFIGSEINPDYAGIGASRLNDLRR